MRESVRQIRECLREVFPASFEAWEDDFAGDASSEKEILQWLRITQAYRGFTATRQLSLQQKQDYFKVFLACATEPRQSVAHTVQARVLSPAEVMEAIDAYYSGGKAPPR